MRDDATIESYDGDGRNTTSSPTLSSGLKAPLKEFTDSTEALLVMLRKLSSADGALPEREKFWEAGHKARESSFALWRATATELDNLLKIRIEVCF